MLKGKKKNLTILLVAVVNIILTAVAIAGLKSNVPINIFASGAIDKMLPKQMLLALPVLVLVIGIFQIIYRLKTMDKPVTTGKLIEDGGFAFLTGTLISVNWLLVHIGKVYTTTMQINISISILYILMGLLGVILIGIYSTFPINKFDSVLGLRTKETKEDKEVWRIANRFNGFTGFVTGIMIIVLAGYYISKGFNWVLLLVVALLGVLLIFYVPRLYAKMIARKKAKSVVE